MDVAGGLELSNSVNEEGDSQIAEATVRCIYDALSLTTCSSKLSFPWSAIDLGSTSAA